jgi:hypothetical protein
MGTINSIYIITHIQERDFNLSWYLTLNDVMVCMLAGMQEFRVLLSVQVKICILNVKNKLIQAMQKIGKERGNSY